VTDLFREAEDELRKDTVESLVRRLAPWVIGGAVVALAAGIGWQFWQRYQAQKAVEAAEQYDAAMLMLQGGDLAGGAAKLGEIAKSGAPGYAAVAAMTQGGALQEKGDAAGARAAFENAARVIRDPDLRDLAVLRAAYIASETETRAQLATRLKPVIDRGGPFALLARELLAAAAWHEGDTAGAKDEYELLRLDPRSPEGLRNRAAQAISVIDAAATPSSVAIPLPGEQGAATPQQPGTTAQGQPRIIRLPPGQRLPPGYVPPPGVQIIETPLPPGATPPAAGGQVSNDMLSEIEAARRVGTERQRTVTEAQQADSRAPVTTGQAQIEQGVEALTQAPAPAAPAAQAPAPAAPAAPAPDAAPAAPPETPKEGN
jgi:hypothetical protein